MRAACVLAAIFTVTGAAASDRILRAEFELPAPVSEVWKVWTTEAGVTSFFAPGAHIEPRVDGAYEIFFNPKAEPGMRGADGMRILAFEPERRLAFTWNAPPSIPAIRGQRTMVVVELQPAGEGRTRLRFTHLGWGEGTDWDAAYAYFDKAWSTFVLPHLKQRFVKGPVDWAKGESPEPLAGTMRVGLVPR
ncbi:MAG TPA: SRPBCC domain-containing protein [Candidatus Polarisedimenticolaceae bacterium]